MSQYTSSFVFYFRGPDDLGFKVFDKVSFRNKFKKPQVEVPPSFGFRFGGPSTETIGTQGFDNPMYGSNPLEVCK